MKQFLTSLTLAFVFVLALSGSAEAQMSVTGKVTDAANGESLIGASVLIKGTQTGTITDVDGIYLIKAKAGDVLAVANTQGLFLYDITDPENIKLIP